MMTLAATIRSVAVSAALIAGASIAAPVSFADGSMVADTCGCKGPSECTCKKCACKCGKCGGAHNTSNTRMIETLKGSTNTLKLPANARHDATAGVFI